MDTFVETDIVASLGPSPTRIAPSTNVNTLSSASSLVKTAR